MKLYIFGVLLIIAVVLLSACSTQGAGTSSAGQSEISSNSVDEDSSLPTPSFQENESEDSAEQDVAASTTETVLPSVSSQGSAEEPTQPSYQMESGPNSKPDTSPREHEPV